MSKTHWIGPVAPSIHCTSRRRRSLARLLVAGLLLVLLGVPAWAQISAGGMGGGLPGSGPGGAGTGPAGSSGGSGAADEDLLYHVLDRTTYGTTDQDLNLARYLGVENFIRLQLRPETIVENTELSTRLAVLPPRYTAVGDPRWDWADVIADYLLRARYSTRQLNEVMTEFWSNHFDTGLPLTSGGFTGYYTSLDYEPVASRPAVAYYDLTAERPYYSAWNGAAWSRIRIDGTRQNGLYTSLDHHPQSNQPAVAYYSQRTFQLIFAVYDGVNFQRQVVPDATSSNYGLYSSFSYGSTGTAYIGYYDAANRRLKVVSGTGATWGVPTVVDSSGDDVGMFASLAIDSADLPRIAYFDNTNQRLKYASWDGAQWQVQVADGTPGVGRYASLALDSADHPAIAYWDAANNRLRFIRHDGVSWSAAQTLSGGGEHASLAFSAGGDPAISYYTNAPAYDLEVVRSSGGTWGTPERLGVSANISGEYSSLAFDPLSDRPGVSYHNGSEFDVRMSQWTGSSWVESNVYRYGTTRFLYAVWEAEESDGFRQNAVGKFRDLLETSATSAAMMLFLNNDLNVAGSGNENYARELLELHTLGVDGGYTQTDVETVARALTGWSHNRRAPRCDVIAGDFCYNHLAHDGTQKTIMGVTFAADSTNTPANWMKQGHEILDFLAAHPKTAQFVCRKMIAKFVADVPPPVLLDQCSRTYLASGGDIRRVLESILLSSEMLNDPANRLNKVRDPFEFTLASARHLEAATDGVGLYTPISNLGMPLFRQDVPTGWPEVASRWIGSNSFLQRWKHADAIAHDGIPNTTIDPYSMVRAAGVTTADGIIELFIRRLLHGEAGGLERMQMLDCLTGGNPGAFDINDPQTPSRIRDMVGVALGFPVYQKN